MRIINYRHFRSKISPKKPVWKLKLAWNRKSWRWEICWSLRIICNRASLPNRSLWNWTMALCTKELWQGIFFCSLSFSFFKSNSPFVSLSHSLFFLLILFFSSLDGYMNVAMENTDEYGHDGAAPKRIGDTFIRGNNVLYIAPQWERNEKKSSQSYKKKKKKK